MTLRDEAIILIRALRSIVESLELCERGVIAAHATQLAARLRPHVEDLDDAVNLEHSRESAQAALTAMSPLMDMVSAMAAKGELAAFENGAIDAYWRLHTIFRETRFAHQTI